MSSFNEAALEQAIIQLLEQQGYPYTPGGELERAPNEVLIQEDLRRGEGHAEARVRS
ncbi:hypothetical protein [Halioxenophilus sp. WMMB6]|uniref:hypothetical protein n=1 Tax=Halioxenophilus sp. WMMB6 TaxID=3073815 RepID=UPI00295E626A|nr:hypothetical protein [Halioxenophilus sp. WMMB6]